MGNLILCVLSSIIHPLVCFCVAEIWACADCRWLAICSIYLQLIVSATFPYTRYMRRTINVLEMTLINYRRRSPTTAAYALLACVFIFWWQFKFISISVAHLFIKYKSHKCSQISENTFFINGGCTGKETLYIKPRLFTSLITLKWNQVAGT